MWMQEAIRITRHGGWLMVFSDWRQLPLTSDALQVAGWTWRAVVTWDKTEACRPHQGMFRNQSEFILIATRGSIGKEQDRPRVFPAGVFRHYLKPSDKMHLTGKPVPLMRHLMTVLPPGSRVLDPFMGSGTTLVAARDLGHVAHGIDLSRIMFALPRTSWAFLFPDRGQPAESSPGFRETRADRWRECLTWDK